MLVVRPYEPPPDYPLDDESPNENNSGVKEVKGEQRDSEMLRSRQYPEIAGVHCDDQVPALRRFTRYNQSLMQRETPITTVLQPQPSTHFGKSASKKLSFFGGNWTFRDKKSSRPAIFDSSIRDERITPSELVVDHNRSSRTSISTKLDRKSEPRQHRVVFRSQPPPPHMQHHASVCLPGRSDASPSVERVSLASLQMSPALRKSCPDIDEAVAVASRLEKERLHRRGDSRQEGRQTPSQTPRHRTHSWKRTPVQDWKLDDVILWLQYIGLEDVASLFIGYDIKGKDLLQWDHSTLKQLGVSESNIRSKILDELKLLTNNNRKETTSKKEPRTFSSVFDLVRKTSCDQVLAVETCLTPRDLSVTGGRMGCPQVTKVDGNRLPLKQNDLLLEINGIPGEQFKSALMLTKLISDSHGSPIKFVVLRRKDSDDDIHCQSDSSSGISSTATTPVDNV